MKLPKLQFSDEIVRSMRRDFGLLESDINRIIDKRFGNPQLSDHDSTPNRQIDGPQPGQVQLSSKSLSSDAINLAILLEKYEQV